MPEAPGTPVAEQSGRDSTMPHHAMGVVDEHCGIFATSQVSAGGLTNVALL
jgi:hypothetical protein